MELERIENDINEIGKSKVLTDSEKQSALAIKEKERLGIKPSEMPKEPTIQDMVRKNVYESGGTRYTMEDGKLKSEKIGLSEDKKADIITKLITGGRTIDDAMKIISRLEGNPEPGGLPLADRADGIDNPNNVPIITQDKSSIASTTNPMAKDEYNKFFDSMGVGGAEAQKIPGERKSMKGEAKQANIVKDTIKDFEGRFGNMYNQDAIYALFTEAGLPPTEESIAQQALLRYETAKTGKEKVMYINQLRGMMMKAIMARKNAMKAKKLSEAPMKEEIEVF